jgi:UbiA prenyltransferase family
MCVLVGAFPGAVPPLIGWTAASGRLSIEAGILYAMLFLWQFPHFMAIAWMYREDYDRAGYLVLPKGNMRVSFVIVENSIAAVCPRRYQHCAISDTARGDFPLFSGSSGNRIRILRMGIRVRAFENCCTLPVSGLDRLSSTAVWTKRDVVQSE